MPLWTIALLLAPQTPAPPIVTPPITTTVELKKPDLQDQKPKLEALARTYDKVAREGYPLIIRSLRMEREPAIGAVKIIVTDEYEGVAATDGAGFGGRNTGARILVSAKYALAHPNDLGMIVHEMCHAVQSYPTYNPVWLVEGIADWVRWFNWEPVAKRPRPNPAKATARDSYQTTGAFLTWASAHYDIYLVPKLNAAFRKNAYKEGLFKEYTGRTLTQLDAEWRASLQAPAPPRP